MPSSKKQQLSAKKANKLRNLGVQRPIQKQPRATKRAGAGGQASVAAAYATRQRTGEAQIYRNGVDSCRVVHRELIGSITGTSAFTVALTLPLNPGMVSTFPWLSNEAAGWEKYKFNSLRFCYYTRTGSNVPGSLMLSPDYDAADAAPTSEVFASAYEDTEEDAPWKDICCVLKQSELMGDMKERYLRQGALAANQDIKMYDSGNMFVCTVDGTAVNWGKLWVEYDVTLITPHTPPGGFQASGFLYAGGGSLAAATPLGSVPVASGPIILAEAATNVLSISNVQVGQVIAVHVVLGGTTMSALTFGTLVGLTSQGSFFSMASSAATSVSAVDYFTVTALNPTLTMSVTAASVTSGYVTVTALSPIPAVF
jgi:hypothetical protein